MPQVYIISIHIHILLVSLYICMCVCMYVYSTYIHVCASCTYVCLYVYSTYIHRRASCLYVYIYCMHVSVTVCVWWYCAGYKVKFLLPPAINLRGLWLFVIGIVSCILIAGASVLIRPWSRHTNGPVQHIWTFECEYNINKSLLHISVEYHSMRHRLRLNLFLVSLQRFNSLCRMSWFITHNKFPSTRGLNWYI